jgi:hypothetical protein
MSIFELFLTDERLMDFGKTSVAILVWYYTLRETTDKSEKRLSWILTLLSSIVTTFGCLPIVLKGYETDWPTEILYGNDRLSRGLVNFFVCYLIWDTIFIYKDYPSIGGIHHHLPYFLFMAVSLHYRCPGMFVVFMPMEFSSIFLSIGHIWPKFRADILFGITFFLGRVIYHFILWRRLYITRNDSPVFVWPFALLPLLIHIQWFSKWALSMWRKTKNKPRTSY